MSVYGIIWMERAALAAAFDMEGAFNDVALRLMAGANQEDVIMRLDLMLERYGGLGATPRSLQLSHWYLNNELNQLQGFATIIPIIFMAVAAFLLNVVLNRIIAVQREQIAALKALGYSNFEVGLHYYKWSLVVALTGVAMGLGVGCLDGVVPGDAVQRVFSVPRSGVRDIARHHRSRDGGQPGGRVAWGTGCRRTSSEAAAG